MVEKRERLLSKDYILTTLSAAGTAFMNFFFMPTFALYIGLLGRTDFEAGLIVTVYSLTALAARPISGMLSDKIGRVKLLIIGAFLCALSCVGLGITVVFPLIVVIRAINGVGFGMHSTCAGAAIADVVPKSRISEGIGYFGLYSTIAQMVAPSIALFIIRGGTISDFKTLFFITMLICLFSTACACGLTYERKRRNQLTEAPADIDKDETPAVPVGELPKTFLGFEYAVFAPIAVVILLYLGLAGIMTYITAFAEWRGIKNSGIYFTFCALGVFVSRMIFGKLTDKRGSDIVIIPGTAVIAVCLVILPSVRSIFQLAALAVPLGLAQGAVLPAFNSMMFKRCSAARRGTASGAYFAALDIGFAVGAPMLGAVADWFDYRYIYWVSAVLVTLSLLVYLVIASDKRYNARLAKNSGKI